jgi:twitching motility protein PilI
MKTPSQALNRPLNWAAQQKKHVHDNQISRRLGFYIGNLGLLITKMATSELTYPLPLCPIPNTAAWLLGLINLRGNLVPVFDLHNLLQLKTRENTSPMLLILGSGDSAGAMLIDGLPHHLNFFDFDKLNTLPPLPKVIQPYTSSGYEKDNEFWFNFDHIGFFEHLATQVAV